MALTRGDKFWLGVGIVALAPYALSIFTGGARGYILRYGVFEALVTIFAWAILPGVAALCGFSVWRSHTNDREEKGHAGIWLMFAAAVVYLVMVVQGVAATRF
jgi:hypothetical protein